MAQIDRSEGLVGNTGIKAPVRLATTANLPLLNGLLTIDGAVTVQDDRVLVKDQTDTTENGIYTADSGDWNRSDDFDGAYDVATGTLVTVTAGTTNIDTYWRIETAGAITIGSTGITFEPAIVDDSATIGFLQAGTGAVARTAQAKMRDIIGLEDFGPAGDGVTNDNAIVQAAIDAAKTLGKTLLITEGTYLITGLYVYPNSHLVFEPGAEFKLSANGIAVKTSDGIGSTAPTGNLDRIKIENYRLNMNSKEGFGLLLECARDSLIANPYIYNIGAGTFSYNDTVATDTYDTAGIAIKGISGIWTAVFNRIVQPRCMGISNAGGKGIWLGTTNSGTTERANVNVVDQAICKDLLEGINIDCGGDNLIIQPEVSPCDKGIRVGRVAGGANSTRNRIIHPYVEDCVNNGVYLNFNSIDTYIDGIGSIGTTPVPVFDNGSGTSIFYGSTAVEANFARFYEDLVHAVGVKFPGTVVPSSDANTLDDYEEGTFVPVVSDASTAGNNASGYLIQKGRYIKIGKLVYILIALADIATVGMTAGNQIFITGLPFSRYTDGSTRVIATVQGGALASTTGAVHAAMTVDAINYLALYNSLTTGNSILPVSAITTGSGDIYTTFVYESAT